MYQALGKYLLITGILTNYRPINYKLHFEIVLYNKSQTILSFNKAIY